MTTTDLQATFDKFLADWNNKFIKVLPNSYPPQCFDQAVKWTDILGVPHAPGNPSPFPYPNAYQIYTDIGSFQSKYFDRIPNTPDYVPKKGDIVVWDGAYNGGVGHVAVATGIGDTQTFQAFSQNVPLNSNAHLVRFSYAHVLGALRLKVTGTPASTTPSMDNRPYFFDLIKNSDIPFDWGTTDSKLVKETKVKEFITWVKSQVGRAGQYDLIAKDAGFNGDTNLVKHDYLAGKLKGMGGCSPEELKKASHDGAVAAQKQIVAAVQNVVVQP